jgi:predicted nucleotidyltransferase
MDSLIKSLRDDGSLVVPSAFIVDDLILEVMMGSAAYGANTPTSDIDLYGIAIPPLSALYPYWGGLVPLFDKGKDPFATFQKSEMQVGTQTYDVKIYSLAHFVAQAANSNPNIIDILYAPEHSRLIESEFGAELIAARSMFVSRKLYFSYTGFSRNELHKAQTAFEKGESWRKNMYLATRNVYQILDFLRYGTVELAAYTDDLRGIRRGEFSFEELKVNVKSMLERTNTYYDSSELPYDVDRVKIRTFLSDMLQRYNNSEGLDEYNHQLSKLFQCAEDMKAIIADIQRGDTHVHPAGL